MTDKSDQPRNRYDVSGNVEAQYVDAAGTVLQNKLGITDLVSLQTEEEKSLARAYRDLLRETEIDTPITCDLIRHIHARIFSGLYEWAGRWRTVWISKPGITWPAPDFLDANMRKYEQEVLRKYPADRLVGTDDFCTAVGEIEGEFLGNPSLPRRKRPHHQAGRRFAGCANRPPSIELRPERGGTASIHRSGKRGFPARICPDDHSHPPVHLKMLAISSKFSTQSIKNLCRKGGQAFNDAVAIGHIQNPFDTLRLIPKPRIRLNQRRPFSKILHAFIISFSKVSCQYSATRIKSS